MTGADIMEGPGEKRGGALFGSMLTAMVTPFREDGGIDDEMAAALAEKLISEGNDGLVVSGTTGESSTLEDDEKERLFRVVKEAAGGRASVIAGAGSNHTSHSVDMAKRAERAGADGLLLVTPYYLKPSQAGIQAHMTAVADATDLPVILYDIPGRAGVEITPQTMLKLAEHPNIVAVKDAKADLTKASYVMANSELVFYGGDDALTLPWIAIGAAGTIGVTTHVAGPQFRVLVDAALKGDLAIAQKVCRELDPVIRSTMSRVPGAVAAKQILCWQGVMKHNVVRLPLVQATEEERNLMKRDLSEAGWSF